MDALEFARERRRMCKSFNESCKLCELRELDCLIGHSRSTEEEDKRVIAVVEKWSKEHPRKTRQTELMKTPWIKGLRVDKNGVLDVCPLCFDDEYRCPASPHSSVCNECRAKWWGEVIE